jgi:hypothetical protein
MELLEQSLLKDENGIFFEQNLKINESQKDELSLREGIASKTYDNYLEELSNHHSIPVMDKEVRLFLKNIP